MVISCDNENAGDCFQKTGNIIIQDFPVTNFTKIRVNRDVELYLKEGPIIEVKVRSGENLMNDIRVNVINNQLTLSDNNACNIARAYNVTKVYVTAPNIIEIRCATQFNIFSEGILTYPEIAILSEDFNDEAAIAVGNVELNLNTDKVNVVGNNLTAFKLSGITQDLNVSLVSGDGIFDGSNLMAQKVSVFHRGTNNLIVNPQLELSGEIRSTGNVIAKNTPPILNIESYYTGELVLE